MVKEYVYLFFYTTAVDMDENGAFVSFFVLAGESVDCVASLFESPCVVERDGFPQAGLSFAVR